MSPELKDLLDDAARSPRRGLNVDDIHRRGRRGRALERAGGAVAAVALLGGIAFGVNQLAQPSTDLPVISDPSPEATATTQPSTAPERAEVSPHDLGVDVLIARDAGGASAGVDVHHPDGSTSDLPIDSDQPSRVGMIPDGTGGVVWQPAGGAAGSPPILRVDADGQSSTLVAATSSMDLTYTLVGHNESFPLVVEQTGAEDGTITEQLFEVRYEGTLDETFTPTPETELVVAAHSLEIATFATTGHERDRIVVSPPRGEQTVVWEAPDADTRAIDVTGSTDTYALVGNGDRGYELLVIDSHAAEPTITERIEVPVSLGLDVEPAPDATEVSAMGDVLLVNRIHDDNWLAPLVLRLDGGDTNEWQSLDRDGRAVLGRPAPPEAETVACENETERRNASPVPGEISLFAICVGSTEFTDAYRLDVSVPATGDAVADAQAALDQLFGGLPENAIERGYWALTLDMYSADSTLTDPSIADIRFSDGTLVLDFDAPSGFGNFSTSAGGAAWHTLLIASLLQIEDVEILELHANGSCEAYPTYFESDGCFRFTDADAPWNRNP